MRLRWAGYEVAAFLKNPMVIIIEIMCSTKRDVECGVLFFVQRRARSRSWSCLVQYLTIFILLLEIFFFKAASWLSCTEQEEKEKGGKR